MACHLFGFLDPWNVRRLRVGEWLRFAVFVDSYLDGLTEKG